MLQDRSGGYQIADLESDTIKLIDLAQDKPVLCLQVERDGGMGQQQKLSLTKSKVEVPVPSFFGLYTTNEIKWRVAIKKLSNDGQNCS